MWGPWKRAWLIGANCALVGCGEVVWFVSFNAGPIETDGLVVIIGTPRDPPPDDIRLIAGQIPKGMEILQDGTVQGIPEEAGPFEFTLEFKSLGGAVDREDFSVDLEKN